MAVAIIKELGFTGTLIVLILPIVLLSILVFLRGFEFSNFKLKGFLKEKKENLDHYRYETEVGDSVIGFEIPKPDVKIFGKLWNKEHITIYRLLEDKWRDCKSVDVTDCNITSTLISLLEDKCQNFGELTIYATLDQLPLLNYLQQHEKIKIEAR